MKFLDIRNMQQLQDYAHRRYYVKLRPGDVYADLFVPTFWGLHRGKLGADDLVRVKAHDGRFDVWLTVADVKVDGVVMQRFPVEPPEEEAKVAAEIGNAERYVPFGADGKPVVRVEHLPATGWRVLGLNGQVSQGHKDEAAAAKAMGQYLKDIRYVMPNEADQLTHLDKHTKLMAAEEERQRLRRERALKR